MSCRICGDAAETVLDLGTMPLANTLCKTRDEKAEEYPLVMERCSCGNFQLKDALPPELVFGGYAYRTPKSPMLDKHYAMLREILQNRGYLDRNTRGLEIGSNTGHLLAAWKPYVKEVLGVEPSGPIAAEAILSGVPTVAGFFGEENLGRFDLVVARHVLAHNPDPYTMLRAALEAMEPNGVLLIENAYALAMFEHIDFDQVYHEHAFYYTIASLHRALSAVGLSIVYLREVDIHGGSLLVLACRNGTPFPLLGHLESERVALQGGIVQEFARSVDTITSDLWDAITRYDTVYAYGATAKGTTLLNSSQLTWQDIPYCADGTESKQGMFLPKAGVEIVSEEWALQHPPDAFLLTAWNYQDEIIAKVRAVLPDMKFIVPIPHVSVR